MADKLRIEELRRRVENDPASIAFAQLAEEFRRAGDYAEAVRVCRSGLATHPTYLSARVTLGRALIELHQYEHAQAEFEHVLRSAPENLAAVRGLAEVHQRRGNLTEALRHYEIALGLAKFDPELEESVHDLNREISSQADRREPPPPPPPAETAGVESGAARAGVTSVGGEPPVIPMSLLSPELEAAADEFTKALQALDALSLDLPGASQPESDEAIGSDEDDVGRTPERAPEPAAMLSRDQALVSELESWLESIVRDRAERHAER